jgi:hypothetical protein
MYISHNQKSNCVAIGSELGFRVISLKTLRSVAESSKFRKVKIIEMYFATNIIFLVSEETPKSVVVYNDMKQEKEEMLSYSSPVERLVVRLNNIYVLVQKGILHVVDIDTFEEKFEVKDITYFSKLILDVPTKAENFIGWSQPSSGKIKLASLTISKGISSAFELTLHGNNACLNFAFDRTGEFIASTSKGTFVKIHSMSQETTRVIWLNYGSTLLSYLSFSDDNQLLIATQSNGEVKLIKMSATADGTSEGSRGLLGKLVGDPFWMKIDTKLENSISVLNPQNDSLFVCCKFKEIQQYKLDFSNRTYQLVDKMNLF